MNCRLADMRHKEVINLKDGVKYGCVSDVEIDPVSAKLIAIVVYGRLRFFGIFGREEDTVIRWENIQVIGDDTILVDCKQMPSRHRRTAGFFENFFSNL